ncbi:uncharacterized protein LOC143182546 isoform X1 [Calliopsis andreniformis]|uniref:uncharacterized protein LOC143182546 isoform X1 n=1 Tax=Calliopsis andreniformis TaxID=337506 RepID=UPI003FCD3872
MGSKFTITQAWRGSYARYAKNNLPSCAQFPLQQASELTALFGRFSKETPPFSLARHFFRGGPSARKGSGACHKNRAWRIWATTLISIDFHITHEVLLLMRFCFVSGIP